MDSSQIQGVQEKNKGMQSQTKYYKVINGDQLSCATKFDEKVDFAKRIELKELLKMNGYQLIEITEEEYNKIPRKLDAI